MAEVINTNVFDAEKKFVDFAGLDYFWEKAKTYVDRTDITLYEMAAALENTVGDNTKGLVKDLADLKATVDALGDIEGGEGLGGMIDAKIGALDVEDVAVDGQYVSSVAEVDGKVVVSRATLPVYEEVGVAAGAAAQALADAKTYADGLKTAIDGVIAENERVTSEALNSLDGRVTELEGIDHNKIATDAAAAAVAGVIDGAPEKFDTLKEVAQWISDSESAASAADLVTRVSTLEAIDHDAYVEADKTVLADAKAYADGLVKDGENPRFDAVGSAAAAEAAAKSYADDTFQVKGNYEEAGAADAALAAAKSYADGKFQVAGNYEAAGTAASAIEALNLPNTYEAKGAAADAQAAAIAQAKLDAADALKSYYTKTEVDNLLSTNSTGDRAYAKQYTDELFSSIKFAANSDIDALFAPKAE